MLKEEEKLISEVKWSHFMAVAYHWLELPQVSFLSQQTQNVFSCVKSVLAAT